MAARRLQVALLDGRGYGPAQIAKVVKCSRPTVYSDLAYLEAESGMPITAERVTAQLRSVVEYVLRPLDTLMAGGKGIEPGAQLAAIRTFWNIYRDRVVMEQALGSMPKEAERLEVAIDAGELARALLKALAVYMDPDSADNMARALGAIDDEQPGFLESLLTR